MAIGKNLPICIDENNIEIKMEMAIQKKLLLSAFSAIFISGVVYFSCTSKNTTSPIPAHVELSKASAVRQTHNDGWQWFSMVPGSPEDQQQAARTFGDEVTELAATRNPADALTAFGIIEGCDVLSPVFELNPTPTALLPQKKQCESITGIMHRSKYDYLRVAANANSPGVGSALLRYGPSGDVDALRTKPNDPSVVEWKQQTTALVIRDGDKGDFNALQDLMNGYAGRTPFFNADPSRELAYSIAYKDIVDLLDLGPIQNRPSDAEIYALAARLSPEQVAWAKDFAAAIVVARTKNATSAIQ